MALYIYLRNMTGGEQDLGTAIRELAENDATDHKPMDILETGDGKSTEGATSIEWTLVK